MIAGTIIVEDTQVIFRHLSDDVEKNVEVTLGDAHNGRTFTCLMTARQFAASIAIMLDPNGGDGEDAFTILRSLADEGHIGIPKGLSMIP